MNLKKLLFLVFMYMMEQEKEELNCSLGDLSVGGLIYIAKMVGLKDAEKLMAKMEKIESKIRTSNPHWQENMENVDISLHEELFDKILEEFEK